MTDQASKAIATCAIWLSTAVILTFGLFRMNGDVFFFLFATLAVTGAAGGSSAAVWCGGQTKSNDAPKPTDQAPRLADEHRITVRPGN